ncbi:MAG TPA: YerC/YecD family TrpR-related protein [Rudaea sp.]|nr:YerC/YecD family TrpR-related protein [Rudaea sp.]
MKRRQLNPEKSASFAEADLCRALLALRTPAQMLAFLRDLCTPAELEALTERWQVVPYLLKGMPYREIHEHTAVSVTTIGRVARFLKSGSGGYQAAIAHDALRGRARNAAGGARP